MAAGFVTLPLLARLLGAEEFGVWTAALAFVGLFTAFSEFGLANAGMQRMAGDPDNEGEWLAALSRLRIVFSIAVAILCLALIPVVFGTSGQTSLVALILVVTIITSGAVSLLAVFQSRLQMGVPLILSTVQSVIWISAVIVLAITDASVVAVAVAYSLLMLIMAVLQVRAARRSTTVTWKADRERVNSLLKLALPIGFGGLFITIYYKIDAVLLYSLADATQAGYYGVAYRILDPLVLLPAAVMGAMMPVVAAHHGRDSVRVNNYVQRSIDLMSVISLPALAVGLVLSDEVIRLLAGPGFSESAQILPILMGAFIVICFGSLAGYLAPVLGLQWRITIYAAIGALANIVLNVILIPEYGAVGSAWATLATESVTMTLLLGTGLHRLGFLPSPVRSLGAIVAATAMAAAMLATRPVGLVVALAAGGLVYIAVLWILRVVTPDEIRQLRSGGEDVAVPGPATGGGVSIVVPSYNRAGALRESLPVALAVAGVDEVVVVDDASTDDTQEYLATIADPRLKVVTQPRNAGVQAARNLGMRSSSGRWIVFGEDDVLMPVDYAQTLVRVAREQDAAIVGSPWLLVRDGDVEHALAQAQAQAVEKPGLDTPSNFPVRTVETPFFPALALVRRDVFDEIRFDEGYGGNSFREETDFFVSAARAGFKVVMTPETYSYQLKTWDGGAHSMRLGYELWSIRNTARFVLRHGRWLRANGHLSHPWLFTVRYTGWRLSSVAEYYARSAAGNMKRRVFRR